MRMAQFLVVVGKESSCGTSDLLRIVEANIHQLATVRKPHYLGVESTYLAKIASGAHHS